MTRKYCSITIVQRHKYFCCLRPSSSTFSVKMKLQFVTQHLALSLHMFFSVSVINVILIYLWPCSYNLDGQPTHSVVLSGLSFCAIFYFNVIVILACYAIFFKVTLGNFQLNAGMQILQKINPLLGLSQVKQAYSIP